LRTDHGPLDEMGAEERERKLWILALTDSYLLLCVRREAEHELWEDIYK
jgi:hypothetical protein